MKNEERANNALKKASELRQHFPAKALSKAGQHFIMLIEHTEQRVQLGLNGHPMYALNFESDLFILEALIADSYTDIQEHFAIEISQMDYGIEFCQRLILVLETKEIKIRQQGGIGFDPTSPESMQLRYFKKMMNRFMDEKKRGVTPTYKPATFSHFAKLCQVERIEHASM